MLMAAEAPEGEGAVESETTTNTTRAFPTNEAAEIKDEAVPTATLPVQEGGHHIEKTATKEPALIAPGTADPTTSLSPTVAPTFETAQFLDQTNLTPEAAMNKGAEVGNGEFTIDENLETIISQDQAQSQAADSQENKLINGIKVLLLLLSVGTAIAWFYLQRRGG
jgi:hypothetical protein